MVKKAIGAFTALLMVASIGQASAHGVWMAQRSGEMAVVYGHGAEDLDMIRRFERIREVSAFDASGAAVKSGVRKTDHLVLFDLASKPSVLALVLDNGFWSRQADGKWVNKGRDEVRLQRFHQVADRLRKVFVLLSETQRADGSRQGVDQHEQTGVSSRIGFDPLNPLW